MVGDTVMIPDFSFTHRKDGRRALLEIVGFWHPHYLKRKLAKVREAGREDLILLVYESVNVAEGAFEEASAGEVFNVQPQAHSQGCLGGCRTLRDSVDLRFTSYPKTPADFAYPGWIRWPLILAGGAFVDQWYNVVESLE